MPADESVMTDLLGAVTGLRAAEWGLDVSRAISDVVSGFWWTAFWPGMAIFVTVLAFNLFGDGMRDAFDPRSR